MRSFHITRLLLIAFLVLITAGVSSAEVNIAISFGPPPLPVYEQPLLPAEGYIWVPGYWAFDYDYDDYYWVPGTWVLPPEPGYLWTPGYWAWNDDRFFFHEGYWGPLVGFYGGIPYGFGYPGEGYEGGRWEGERFFYNRAVNNVNVTEIHNVYNTTVVENTTTNRISYSGGQGGITARPTPQDEIAARGRRLPPVAAQTQNLQAARGNPQLRASMNRGKPPVAATPRPGAFSEHGAVAARQAGGPYHPAPARANNNNNEPRGGSASRPDVPRPPAHATDVQPHQRPAPPNTGNARTDQKYQQQQEKLYNREQQDHQKLAQQQERDHQRMQEQQARQANEARQQQNEARQQQNEARQQQMEQRHQQQTTQMEQRHAEQQQRMQQRQPPPSHGQPPPNHEEPKPH